MVIDQEPDDEDLSILKPMMEHEKTLNLPPFSYNITWSLRCTPKEGFLEEHKSVTICAEYTREHVYILNPQVIIALGRAANMQLTDMTNKSMDEVRKNGYFFYHYPVVPSFGLKDIKSARNDVERSQVKQKIFRDLKKVRSLLQGDNDE